MTQEGKSQADTHDITKYRSSTLEDPKSDATKRKWMEIYYEYAQGDFTERNLAQKYGLSISHVCKIIKWSVHQIQKDQDTDTYKQVMIDKLKDRQQYLNDALKRAKNQKSIQLEMVVMKEKRMIDRLEAQVKSIIGTGSDDKSGKVQVNVQINDLSKVKTEVNE